MNIADKVKETQWTKCSKFDTLNANVNYIYAQDKKKAFVCVCACDIVSFSQSTH